MNSSKWKKMIVLGIAGFAPLFSWSVRTLGPEPASSDDQAVKTRFRDWLIVSAIAILFILYGFMAFFIIGDKGPPDWDFGIVPDVPGESIYSSSPRGPRFPEELTPQHVQEKPPPVQTGGAKPK